MPDRPLKSRLLGLGCALACGATLPMPTAGQSWGDFSASRQRAGEPGLAVQVRYGAGVMDVRATDTPLLYRLDVRFDQDVFEPVHNYEDGELTVGVRSVGQNRSARTRSGGSLQLQLGAGIATSLDMELGAVHADVDLGGLSLTNLSIKTGASKSIIDVSAPNPIEMRQVTFEAGAAEFEARNIGNLNAEAIRINAGVGDVRVDFDGSWRRDAEVDLNVGLGSVELHFPRDLAVRLRRSGFLAAVDVDGLDRDGNSYYSPNWNSAEHHITVDVNAAFGSVRVEWGR